KQSIDRFSAESGNKGNWLQYVESIRVIDPASFQVKLKRPFGPAMQVLFGNNDGGPWLMPKEIVDQDLLNKQPIGTGPFVFDSWEPSVVIRWKRNPSFYDAPRPYVDAVDVSLASDPEVILQNLVAGKLDFSQWTGDQYTRAQKAFPKGVFINGPEQIWGGAYFNFAKKPFGDERVR